MAEDTKQHRFNFDALTMKKLHEIKAGMEDDAGKTMTYQDVMRVLIEAEHSRITGRNAAFFNLA